MNWCGNIQMSDEKYFNETLDEMSSWANGIAAEWNGDEPGVEEDRAMQAEHITRLIEDLREQINIMEKL